MLKLTKNMNKKLLITTFRNISLAAIYIFLVSQLMQNGEKLFGRVDNNILGPFAILLLFSLSAAIVGSLVFGHAVYLFLIKDTKKAMLSAIYSIGWLFFVTVIVFLFLIIL